jgi:hypothetical protein
MRKGDSLQRSWAKVRLVFLQRFSSFLFIVGGTSCSIGLGERLCR